MEYFNQSIQQHFGRLSEDELEIVRSYFKREKLKKNDFFTKADKICDKLSLVKSGIMGFFFDEPNRWNVQALTDVELFTVKKSDYRKLCDEFPKWNEIEKRFIIKCFAMTEDRVFSHLSMTAEERYDLYFEQHKELFNQVPLQYIASVLGMTAETFSRIRKRQAESS